MEIEVILVEAATGREIGRTALPDGELPADFLEPTRLDVGGETWEVVRADPPTREDYVLAGALRLYLERPEAVLQVDPAVLNLSMSSICDELPPDGEPAGDRMPLTVKDDLWRDTELVGPGHEAAIEANFAAIREIRDRHRSGPGFTRLHVRVEPKAPLAGVGLLLPDLLAALGAADRGAVAVPGGRECVRGGFAVPVGGAFVYGLVDAGGLVRVAAVDHLGGNAAAAARPLAALMAAHGLTFVDWRDCLRIGDEAALERRLAEPARHLWR